DNRLGDYFRPPLWRAHSEKQVYLVSGLTSILDKGPACTVCSDIPDLHFFPHAGGKDVVPLYRDAVGAVPNIAPAVLEWLQEMLPSPPAPLPHCGREELEVRFVPSPVASGEEGLFFNGSFP
ncbi:MAG: type ISP restriction/modification enzyme, partial [Anaerolineae bacterium]|uniref:type ISP restriction/modification enzyme n=1 Tax=Thermoflexus sp. TaxID=1969742 RepID=UPI0025F64FB1